MFKIICSAVLGFTTAMLATAASATPVSLGRTETATDHVSAGVGGVGTGPGTITISGVTGTVRKAFLYWHGIDNGGFGQVYDNESVEFAGSLVVGLSLGDAETNCWGPGSSRAFFADVTSLVAGNGNYVIRGLNSKTGHNGNGASLVVLFNDANSSNDRDLVFFEGNDSDVILGGGPAGDAPGWSATLNNINYTGGDVFAEMHVGDGQSFGDATVVFSGDSILEIVDTAAQWDGNSLPNAGSGRAGSDGLWDIHRFDITTAFGEAGNQTISLGGMLGSGDCHSLVVLMLELRAGSAPCGNGTIDEGEDCDPGSTTSADCEGGETCINDCSCGCANDFQCNDGSSCTSDTCDIETGTCQYGGVCNSGPGCEDTCDEAAGACRLCGHPVSNQRCVVNAAFVLQGALGLHPCQLCFCDVNSNGSVTTTDSMQILRSCVGLPVDLQCSVPATTTTIGL